MVYFIGFRKVGGRLCNLWSQKLSDLTTVFLSFCVFFCLFLGLVLLCAIWCFYNFDVFCVNLVQLSSCSF